MIVYATKNDDNKIAILFKDGKLYLRTDDDLMITNNWTMAAYFTLHHLDDMGYTKFQVAEANPATDEEIKDFMENI